MPSHDTATRAQVLVLKQNGFKNEDIAAQTGVSNAQIKRHCAAARERGWDPAKKGPILDSYVERQEGSGRPQKLTQAVQEEVCNTVGTDRYGSEKTCAQIGGELHLSAMSVWRALKRSSYRKTKPTRKPGLTEAMKKERLDWCLAHEHWTLEDWANIIWSDETSVILGHRRGGTRVWRKATQRVQPRCIRPRWKGAKEFMFWGCFSYDKKGPMHIWQKETAAQRRAADKHLAKLNADLEPIAKAEWELAYSMSRLGLRNKPGKRAQWQFTKERGKLVRSGKQGNIDWYAYQQQIILKKLIPFAQECQRTRPGTLVQEDKAPAHASKHQAAVYDAAGVSRLLWMGNSPDLNAIEPTWAYLKRETTKKGAPIARSVAEKAWTKAWKDLEQWRIQRWIRRIMYHVKEIIRCKGGNEYIEGNEKPADRIIKRRRPICVS